MRHFRSFIRSSLERIVVVGAWLALGFSVWEIQTGPLLAGFIVGMLAWMLAAAARPDTG